MFIILNRKNAYSRCLKERGIDEKLRRRLQEDKMYLYNLFDKLGLVSKKVLNAFLNVPRECFVPRKYVKYAYIDEPLPIGKDATISAISMSLLMCEYALLEEGNIVLEIGTGSGYQAALIAELVYAKDKAGNLIRKGMKRVYSTEIEKSVYEFGVKNLDITGYLNFIEVKLYDGTLGWPDDIKFDAIIVTAAGEIIPPPLIEQLKVGGRLIMPLGKGFWQQLIRLTKTGSGKNDYKIEYLEEVRFVQLKGKYGAK